MRGYGLVWGLDKKFGVRKKQGQKRRTGMSDPHKFFQQLRGEGARVTQVLEVANEQPHFSQNREKWGTPLSIAYTPSAVLIAEAIASVRVFIFSRESASIITRARVSVPE